MSKKKHTSKPLPSLQGPLIDSHCHVIPRVYGDDLAAVLARAQEGGLERLINIGAGYGMESCYQALELAGQHAWLHPTIGIHPHEASLLEAEPARYQELLRLAQTPGVVAYGEIGLDYYYDHSPREVQQAVFRTQLEVARQLGLPIIVHDRDAHQDTLDILDEARAWDQGVVLHCFSGDWALAQATLARGGFLSIPGVVTFPKAGDLREVAARAPLERLFLETDSPYLAPVPYRGRRNEPAYVKAVAVEVADLRGISAEEVAMTTSSNVRRFFRIETAS